MKRILIIGCGGAGKTTLARQLGEKLNLPVVHLDQIFWSPGNWQHMERAAFDAALERELAKESWIMDGNYDRTLPLRMQHCDTIIYLDFTMVRCMTGWLGRVIKTGVTPERIWRPAATSGSTRKWPASSGAITEITASVTTGCSTKPRAWKPSS